MNLTQERGTITRTGRTGRTGGPGAGAWLTGPVMAGRFDVALAEAGSVVGVKFTVGGIAAFAGPDPAAIRDRTVPAAPWFPALPELPADADVAAPLLDAWLQARGPASPPGYAGFRRLVALAADPAVTGVDGLAAAAGLSPRTVQRLFRRFAGVGAKAVLTGARVQDAVAELDRSGPAGRPDLAELAARLGWADQAHFTRDFGRATGWTPGRYAARTPR